MTKEPEPRSTGQGSSSSFSVEDQLSVFRRELDEKTGKLDVIKIVPGYLFRDGRERRAKLTPSEIRSMGKWGWGGIDEDLLKQHAETYREALEARSQLLERIKPVEIVQMVRDVWSNGEIEQKTEGATLTYSYLLPIAEHELGHWIPSRSVGSLGNTTEGGYISSGRLTGKWFASRIQMTAGISVGFGNTEFPVPGNTYTQTLNEFFADHYYSSFSAGEFPYVPLPQKMWRRPDNLVILASIPSPKPIGQGSYIINNIKETSFDQSISQQEIMDFLSQKLEAQKRAGLLPSQLGAIENAKIEELRKRGLFLETAPRIRKV